MQTPLDVTQLWLEAANSQDVDRLIEVSDSNTEIVGPRGSAFGHQILREWLKRAELNLTTLRIFAQDNIIVLAQHAVWHSVEGSKIIGEADVASEFRVKDQKVVKYARYETLDEALKKAGINSTDEQLETNKMQ